MRRLAMLILAVFIFLPSCGQVAQDFKIAKRLKDLEKSVTELKAGQAQAQEQWENVVSQQDYIDGELKRTGQGVETDHTEITALQEEMEDDTAKLDEVAEVVSQLLEPIYRIQTAIINMRKELNTLSATQTQIVKQMPNPITNAPAHVQTEERVSTDRLIDWKKYKKAMEEVG